MTISFDGSASFAQGMITSYAWNFGDMMAGAGSTVSHTYASPGVYTVTLTVTDNFMQTHEFSQDIVVFAGANPMKKIIEENRDE